MRNFSLRNLTTKLESLESSRILLEDIDLVQSKKSGNNLQERKVYLEDGLDLSSAFLFTLMNLRIISQEYRYPLLFNPRDALFYHRLIKVDMDVFVCKVAWEANLQGWSSPMNTLLRVDNSLEGFYSDLMGVFRSIAQKDFRTIRSGEASIGTLDRWFGSNKPLIADKFLIEHILLDKEYCSSRGARGVLSVDEVLRVGKTPKVNNYLGPSITALISNPWYSQPRDRKLANSLYHIELRRGQVEDYLNDGGGLDAA